MAYSHWLTPEPGPGTGQQETSVMWNILHHVIQPIFPVPVPVSRRQTVWIDHKRNEEIFITFYRRRDCKIESRKNWIASHLLIVISDVLKSSYVVWGNVLFSLMYVSLCTKHVPTLTGRIGLESCAQYSSIGMLVENCLVLGQDTAVLKFFLIIIFLKY